MSRILALDLGTRLGYAVGINGKLLISATVEHKSGRYNGGGMRFLKFRSWLTEVYESTKFDRIYFEEVRRHLSVDSAHVYGGFLAMLRAWCEERSIPYEGLPVGTIKKDATGKGNASKSDVVKAMNVRWNTALDESDKTADDNEADALAILHCALCHEPAPPRERRIFRG
jgi:Holliday junction resolvasome RuvABC endonuclease subunit